MSEPEQPTQPFPKGALLEYASYFLAAFAVVIGTIAVFSRSIPEHHDKALLWFLFALIAIMIPGSTCAWPIPRA